MKQRKKGISIYSLSNELGLSPSTVSKALKNSPEISQKTRKLVRGKAEEYGFKPREFTSQSTNICALIQAQDRENFIFSGYVVQLMEGIWQYSEENDIEMSFYSNNVANLNDVDLQKILYRRNVDGVIVINADIRSDYIRKLLKQNLPLCHIQSGGDLDSAHLIVADNRKALETATRHLILMGHKKIAYVNAIPGLDVGMKREEGYKEAMADAGLADNILTMQKTAGLDAFRFGYQCANTLANAKITAAITSSVPEAMGLMRGLEVMGVNIPADISVVACDNYPESQYLNPPLSVIDFPNRQLGYMAAQYVHHRIKGESAPLPPASSLRCDMIMRESLAPPKQ